MQDPANDLLPPPSSPTNSSISSSDLDTESTGSFFHDRSTTLGTLMGVTFPAAAFRAPSQRRRETTAAAAAASSASSAARSSGGERPRSKAAAERRRRWWSLCRDGEDGGGARPSSLGEFLEVERRFGDGGGGGADLFGAAPEMETSGGGRALFADGRVLPPAVELRETASSPAADLCRFPVLITGICSGCVG